MFIFPNKQVLNIEIYFTKNVLSKAIRQKKGLAQNTSVNSQQQKFKNRFYKTYPSATATRNVGTNENINKSRSVAFNLDGAVGAIR